MTLTELLDDYVGNLRRFTILVGNDSVHLVTPDQSTSTPITDELLGERLRSLGIPVRYTEDFIHPTACINHSDI